MANNNFGCCSRYFECSDAKKCIHPDQDAARYCSYKSNLEQGKIFYGKNRTIGQGISQSKGNIERTPKKVPTLDELEQLSLL